MPTPTTPRRWQARIEVATITTPDHSCQAHCVYGETVDKLREAVREYLLKAKPERFRNIADHLVGRTTYFYSLGVVKDDGAMLATWDIRSENRLSRNKRCFLCPLDS